MTNEELAQLIVEVLRMSGEGMSLLVMALSQQMRPEQVQRAAQDLHQTIQAQRAAGAVPEPVLQMLETCRATLEAESAHRRPGTH